MNRNYILLLPAFIILFSCSELSNDVVIDPELQPYVDRFLAEAAARGHDIDLEDSGLDMLFEVDISTADFAGQCRYKLGANEIVIDRERWDDSNETRKEWLIYHELGHCVLDRRHRNDQFDNGMWKSLMRGDLSSEQSRLPLCYTWDREQYFIDELFDEDVEEPDWLSTDFSYQDGPERGEEIFSLEPETEGFDNFLPQSLSNFEFEYTYWRKGNGAFASILYGGNANMEYHIVSVDHTNNEVLVGNNELICMRGPFDNITNNKVTVRQKDGTTSVFINEQFVHSFPAYKEPITRVRKAGPASVGFREFRFWSLK